MASVGGVANAAQQDVGVHSEHFGHPQDTLQVTATLAQQVSGLAPGVVRYLMELVES